MVKLPARSEARRPGGGTLWLAGRRLAIGILAIATVGIVALIAAVAGSERLQRQLLELSGAASFETALASLVAAPERFVASLLYEGPIDRLSLDVKFKNLHTIHERRREALRTGELSTSDQDLVPADVKFAGVTVPSQLRLAGDRPELLQGEKWPLRVHTRGDGHVLGLRRLTLLDPALRGFQTEALYFDQLRHEDVIAPRSRLVDLTLNGKHIGLMTLEEFPSTELLEHQQRRDGPILRLDAAPGGTVARAEAGNRTAAAAAVSPLRPTYLAGSRKLKRALKTGKRLLEAYLAGRIHASDAFDTELTGRFLAVTELWGAADALEWQNLRFYYNPLTARFEPFPQATGLRRPPAANVQVTAAAPFAAALLADAAIRAAFDASLERIASEMRSGEFKARLLERQALELRLLHREYPLRLPFDADALQERAAQLRVRHPTQLEVAVPEAGRSGFELPLPTPLLAEVLDRHRFLRWNEAARSLQAEPGLWQVEGSLILPPGVGLALPPGTILRFQPKQGLIARGPLRFLGAEGAPVVLEGPPGRKSSQRWSGVYVIESDRPSFWSHVLVRNTGGFKRHGWSLPGGVVFRKATVELEHCSFSGNLGDDSLNVVRTHFSLSDVDIFDSLSDGFDGDYADGSISGGNIARAGGDAIDVGGSHVAVQGTHITDIRDKAISVGERSRLSADAVVVGHAGIGVASKNGSEAVVTGSSFDDISDVAFVAYTNRPEFGPGTLTASSNRITRTAVPALAQAGSRIVLDGTLLPAVDAAIDRLHKDRDTEP
jgi:hypothetical protein